MNKVDPRSKIYSSNINSGKILENQQKGVPDIAKIARLKALIDALNVNK